MDEEDLDTGKIKEWRSIVTLIVFVFTNLIVLFPVKVPIPFPRTWRSKASDAMRTLRMVTPKQHVLHSDEGESAMTYLHLPLNFVTGPLLADLFLLAISAIGRKEVRGGTIGEHNIIPIDIMVFFLTLAYIAISIDASGLIRYLAFRVLKWGGDNGRRLYLYLYLFFFGLSSFIGNDPIILSGTAFLAYMTRVSRNIVHPRAWIHMQFAVANIGSAILVSSNPTNLVLAGAFNIKFIAYTANMIVPTVVTAVILCPFLLWIKFNDNDLIPKSIELHRLEGEERRAPANPNIPHAGGTAEAIKLEEVLNPFLDKKGAAFGAIMMALTLVAILALNAASSSSGTEHPVFYVTLPAAAIVLCFDLVSGWTERAKTRPVAQRGRYIELAIQEEKALRLAEEHIEPSSSEMSEIAKDDVEQQKSGGNEAANSTSHRSAEKGGVLDNATYVDSPISQPGLSGIQAAEQKDDLRVRRGQEILQEKREHPTLKLLFGEAFWWLRGTFPVVAAVMTHLPWALVPFAFCMFILVQALVTKGWVPVFAYGWDHWVSKTGIIGAVGGMGFLSVVLCNFAGTNIGTTILLCRVIQAWLRIHQNDGEPITQRTFWATVYSMAVGVNYGAFSTAFSASLAGLLWRDILARKEIKVRGLDFAWTNLGIIAVAMVVGLVVLIGEVHVSRSGSAAYLPSTRDYRGPLES